MKILISGIFVLICSFSCLAAGFKEVAIMELQSNSLRVLAISAIKIQRQNEIVLSYGQNSPLETRAFEINPTPGQYEVTMIKQLLRRDFNCRTEATIMASISGGKNLLKAFTVKRQTMSNDYLMRIENYKAALLNQSSTNKALEIYDVSYSGGGECEFGKDGVIILDKVKAEAVFISSEWSS